MPYDPLKYQNRKQKHWEIQKKWRLKNPEKLKESNRKYRLKYRLKIRLKTKSLSLKYKYGISQEECDRMHLIQDSACKICLRINSMSKNGIVKRLSVDHCHSTGKVRGLLCTKCNSALGLIGDDLKILDRMKEYLLNALPVSH